MYVTAGSWLMASVWTLLMTAILSTTLAVHGSNSVIGVPHLPAFTNSNFDGATGNRCWPLVMVVRRWLLMTLLGRSLSNISFIFGLWAHRSICAGPPFMKR